MVGKKHMEWAANYVRLDKFPTSTDAEYAVARNVLPQAFADFFAHFNTLRARLLWHAMPNVWRLTQLPLQSDGAQGGAYTHARQQRGLSKRARW